MGKRIGVLPVVTIVVALVLNSLPRSTHYPQILADVWDAPYANPQLVEQLENDEYRGVQYGFPFNAYETWWHQDYPSRMESALLLGAFGNV